MMMRTGLIGLAALALTAAAPLIQGDPIPNKDIVLQGDPSSLTVSGATDRSGVALMSARPGRYALMLPNVETLRVPAVARVEIGRSVLTTNTIQPGGRGNAYFMGRDGRRLSLMVPRGTPVRIVLTEGAPVAGGAQRDAPGGPSGPVRHLPDLPAQSATGTNPEGREGVRVDPRIPPPAPRAAGAQIMEQQS